MQARSGGPVVRSLRQDSSEREEAAKEYKFRETVRDQKIRKQLKG